MPFLTSCARADSTVVKSPFEMSVPPPNAVSARVARFVTRYAVALLVVALAVTGASVYVLRTLKIRANLFALLPPSLPEVKKLQHIYDKTGGFGDVVVIAEGGTREGSDAFFADLLPAINKLTWTKGADYRVDLEALKVHGLIKGRLQVKILGDGELAKPLKIKAHAFSKSAQEKIKKAGGTIEVIGKVVAG